MGINLCGNFYQCLVEIIEFRFNIIVCWYISDFNPKMNLVIYVRNQKSEYEDFLLDFLMSMDFEI